MAVCSLPPSLLSQNPSPIFSSQNYCRELKFSLLLKSENTPLFRCFAKKKISFVDEILDYIEGGPKLRRWYGAPDLLSKDGSSVEDEEKYTEEEDDEDRDAVLVTDGDSDIGQMILLQLIVKRTRIKAVVKDKRKAMEAFGTYVEAMTGDAGDKSFLKKALRCVRAIISPSEGFLSNAGSLKCLKHIVLLSQLSVYRGSSGIQAMMKNKSKKLAENDESAVLASGIPYTIIRAGRLANIPGGTLGFSFEEGKAANGSLSKEDAARICMEALNVIPETGLIFEVVNGEEEVLDWQERLTRLQETQKEKK